MNMSIYICTASSFIDVKGFSVIDQGALCQRASLLHPSRLERALRNINSQLWSVAPSRYGAFLWGYPQILYVILDVSLNHPAIYLWKPPQYPQLLISNTMYPVESCATSHQLPLPRSTFRWQHIMALLVLPTRRTRSRREFGTFS